jgi:alpha-1,3-fucosyltransferase
VSHCKTGGGREHYADELAKHIDVAIYGKCGNYTCPEHLNCKKVLEEKYKFYLSFENSACIDYATEKLFAIFTTRMIPIVYGFYDYKKNLPDNSYIDVRDYKSPKHLAEYLKTVSQNKTIFDSYFQWKSHSKVKQDYYGSGTCELCDYLHRTRHDSPRTFDLELYWSPTNNCIRKDLFLKSVGVDISI